MAERPPKTSLDVLLKYEEDVLAALRGGATLKDIHRVLSGAGLKVNYVQFCRTVQGRFKAILANKGVDLPREQMRSKKIATQIKPKTPDEKKAALNSLKMPSLGDQYANKYAK